MAITDAAEPTAHEATASGNYRHEISEHDDRELLATIKQCRGMVLLSGHPNLLYDRVLRGWTRQDFLIDNKAAGGESKWTMAEAVWTNFLLLN